MSTIYFVIGFVVFLSTISARPSPRVIYSAVIYNKQNSSIQCKITWLKPTGGTLQSDLLQVEANKIYAVNEKLFDMDTWTARAIIQRIQCDDFVLVAPFEGVHGPSIKWKFVVKSDGIASIKPKSAPS
jgi:hypothetical protein